MTQQSRNMQPHYQIICLILPLLCLTELHPPFISQTLRDGTPQVQMLGLKLKISAPLSLHNLIRRSFVLKGKGKGKVPPITGHEDPQGEQRQSSILSLTSALVGVVCSTPRPSSFISGKDPVPIVQEAGWAQGPVRTGDENLASTGIRYPDRPARSESLYRLSYPDPLTQINSKINAFRYPIPFPKLSQSVHKQWHFARLPLCAH